MAKETIQCQVAPLIHPALDLNNVHLRCRQDATLVTADQIFKWTGPRLQFQDAIIALFLGCCKKLIALVFQFNSVLII